MDTLTAGYGYSYTITRDTLHRWIGEVWAGGRRYKRVSAPGRVECVEMLVAWIEAS